MAEPRKATTRPARRPAAKAAVRTEPATAPAAKAAPRAAGKAWTILVWIAGDNSLSDFGEADIAELKQVGSTPSIDLVVQYDRSGRTGTKRYHLNKGTTLAEDAVADLGETNTGDPQVAIDFFTWGIQTYPARQVMCVLWNHGSGIDETDIYARARTLAGAKPRARSGARARGARSAAIAPPAGTPSRQHVRAIASSRLNKALFSTTIDEALLSKAIAYDDTSRDFLDNAELARVLASVATNVGRPVDVLGFDACLMNMIEIGYELRRSAGIVVGSEEVEPGDGWPYHLVARAASRAAGKTPAKLAAAVVKGYHAFYLNSSESAVTQSALDLTKVEALAQAVDGLAAACTTALQSNDEYAAFSRALTAAQRFEVRDFVDLGDLCKQLAARSSDPDIQACAKSVIDRLTGPDGAVISNATKGASVAGATGATIYFPTVGDVNLVYDRLAFARDTRWPKLIARYRSF